MTADQYLQTILAREAVDTSATSPVRGVQATLQPILDQWAGTQFRNVHPSGSFAKGTANRSGTDIDLFISLKSDTTNTLKEIYTSLFDTMKANGYAPEQQNVSINIRIGGYYDVDLVPAKHQGGQFGRSQPISATSGHLDADECGQAYRDRQECGPHFGIANTETVAKSKAA